MSNQSQSLDQSGRVVSDPAVCNGKPTVRGARITVASLLEYLAAGDSIEDILADFPTLGREDVLACLQYAAGVVDHGVVVQRSA